MKYSFTLGQQISSTDINQILNLKPSELIEKLNSQIGAVEGVKFLGEDYANILVVKVVSVEPHPDADKLKVVRIDDGEKIHGLSRDEDGLVQVVCGAPNVKAGMLAAWIPPGATVPSTLNDSEPFKLSVIKLRGVTSNGMLASPKELNLSDDHSGILDLISLTPTQSKIESVPLPHGEGTMEY